MLEGIEATGGGYGFGAEMIPWSDEIGAGANALVDFLRGAATGNSAPIGDLYNEHVAISRADQDAWRDAHPVARVGANVLGGASTGAAAMIGNALRVPTTFAGTVGQNALGGALYGGAAGSGEGEGLLNRAETGAVGAAVGGAVGAAVPAVAEGVRRLVNGVRYVKGLKGPEAEKRAYDMLTEALQKDGMSIADLGRVPTNGKPLSIADLGPNTRDLIGSAARTGGEGKRLLDEFFDQRTLGQYGRISDDVAGGTGANGRDFARTAEDVAARRAAQAKPGYDAAYMQPAPTLSDGAAGILKTPDGKRALSTAARFMANRQRPMTDDAGNYTVEALDQIQRAMRDLSSRAKGARAGEQSANISALRDQFLAEVPDELRTVMAAYRSQSELLDAMTAGRQFLKGDAEALGTSVSKMTPQEADMFRLGVARELRGKMGTKIDSGDISGMFQNPQMRERLQSVFPSKRLFQDFMEKVQTERVMQETRNSILKGSQTASRMVSDDEFGAGALGEAAADVLTGGGNVSLTRAAMGMAMRGKDRLLQGVNQEVARHTANVATQTLPQAAQSLSRGGASVPVPYSPGYATPISKAAVAAVTAPISGSVSSAPVAGWQIIPAR